MLTFKNQLPNLQILVQIFNDNKYLFTCYIQVGKFYFGKKKEGTCV